MDFIEVVPRSILRLRNWFIWLVPLIVFGLLFMTDPDAGRSTFIWALRLASASASMTTPRLTARASTPSRARRP